MVEKTGATLEIRLLAVSNRLLPILSVINCVISTKNVDFSAIIFHFVKSRHFAGGKAAAVGWQTLSDRTAGFTVGFGFGRDLAGNDILLLRGADFFLLFGQSVSQIQGNLTVGNLPLRNSDAVLQICGSLRILRKVDLPHQVIQLLNARLRIYNSFIGMVVNVLGNTIYATVTGTMSTTRILGSIVFNSLTGYSWLGHYTGILLDADPSGAMPDYGAFTMDVVPYLEGNTLNTNKVQQRIWFPNGNVYIRQVTNYGSGGATPFTSLGTYSALPNTLLLRDAAGRSQVADPVDPLDVVNFQALQQNAGLGEIISSLKTLGVISTGAFFARTVSAYRQINAVQFGNGRFVACYGVTTNYGSLVSLDGITWTIYATSTICTINKLMFINGAFYGAGRKPDLTLVIVRSMDGVTWESFGTVPASGSSTIMSLAYGNNLFMLNVQNSGDFTRTTCNQAERLLYTN